MKLSHLIFFFLLIGCKNKNQEIKYETITIDQSEARKLIDLSINCVDKKFPYKIGPHFMAVGTGTLQFMVTGLWLRLLKTFQVFPRMK